VQAPPCLRQTDLQHMQAIRGSQEILERGWRLIVPESSSSGSGSPGYFGRERMTFFHFVNCALLAFGPHVIYYKATPL